jgi:hypothetical protein
MTSIANVVPDCSFVVVDGAPYPAAPEVPDPLAQALLDEVDTAPVRGPSSNGER